MPDAALSHHATDDQEHLSQASATVLCVSNVKAIRASQISVKSGQCWQARSTAVPGCQRTQAMLQDIREYELDYEAAKKAAAAVAVEAEKEEERRIKLLEKNPLGELLVEEEEDFNLGGFCTPVVSACTHAVCKEKPSSSSGITEMLQDVACLGKV